MVPHRYFEFFPSFRRQFKNRCVVLEALHARSILRALSSRFSFACREDVDASEGQKATESRRASVVIVRPDRVELCAKNFGSCLYLAGRCERFIGKSDCRLRHCMFVRLQLALLQCLP